MLYHIYGTYDQVRENFIIPRSIPDMDYDQSDDVEKPDTADIETEEHAAEGKGLKILIPQQMLSRLPISLAQLKAGSKF